MFRFFSGKASLKFTISIHLPNVNRAVLGIFPEDVYFELSQAPPIDMGSFRSLELDLEMKISFQLILDRIHARF